MKGDLEKAEFLQIVTAWMCNVLHLSPTLAAHAQKPLNTCSSVVGAVLEGRGAFKRKGFTQGEGLTEKAVLEGHAPPYLQLSSLLAAETQYTVSQAPAAADRAIPRHHGFPP